MPNLKVYFLSERRKKRCKLEHEQDKKREKKCIYNFLCGFADSVLSQYRTAASFETKTDTKTRREKQARQNKQAKQAGETSQEKKSQLKFPGLAQFGYNFSTSLLKQCKFRQVSMKQETDKQRF